MSSEAIEPIHSNAAVATLPPAVDAERLTVDARAGALSYYRAGVGAPMLLIHSINAAASAFEVRPIFEHLRAKRCVYAVDLPGFGFSSRAPRRYDVPLYCAAVLDMLDVIGKDHPDQPIDALALSLSSEFLARVATRHPERFRHLALVNPTGFNGASRGATGPTQSNREIPGLHKVLTVPLWRETLYRSLTRRETIHYFLKRTYGSAQVDEEMVDYDALTARQPGASHAPYAFLSGRLFSRDVRTVYEQLEMPVWVGHGVRGDFKDFSQAEWARRRSNWQFTAFSTGALPHFERPLEFMSELDAFVDGT